MHEHDRKERERREKERKGKGQDDGAPTANSFNHHNREERIMNRFTGIAAAFILFVPVVSSHAQPAPAEDRARQDTVIKQAMRTYQQGLSDLKESSAPRVQPGTSAGTFRELRLEEAVTLALEKNLDIQVAKLEPQSVDFLIAGVKNQFQPVLASTVGQRDLFQLPTRTINGGTRVSQATTTYNASIAQEVPLFGGSYNVSWSNQRVASTDALATRNPLYTTGLVAAYVQPLLRGFKTDNLRQQLSINVINREISEESARATVTQTLANVRNAYWDLVFARVRSTSPCAPPSWPTSWWKTTRRAWKWARSRRSTSCRPRRKPRRGARTSPPPKPPRRRRKSR